MPGVGTAGIEKKGYISCQGESGSCAFGASRVHYFNYVAAPQPSFEEVVRRVVERDAGLGVLPIQNSRSGLIGEPLTVLARSDLFVTAEHYQPITHHLMVSEAWVKSVTNQDAYDDLLILNGKPEKELTAGERAKLDQVRRSLLSQVTAIYSDEQGLKQCDRGLKINLASAERRLTSCTAKASRIIAHETEKAKLDEEELPAYAAIASEECATMYKNIRLLSPINDDKANMTRYVAISRDEAKASQIVADIDVKALVGLLGQWEEDDRDIHDEDKKLVSQIFSVEPLQTQYNTLSDEFGFGDSSFRAGQVMTARARLLRAFLAGDKDALQMLMDRLDFPAQLRLKLKLEPLALQIREHAAKGEGKEGEQRLKELLRGKKYNDKVRSLFIIRAKTAGIKQADILKALVEKAGRTRRERIEFNIITELPRPIDAKDEGYGLVMEADGSLLGASKALAKKKASSEFAWGFGGSTEAEPSDLERVLREMVDAEKVTIRVLGTFARDPRRFGATAQTVAEKPARKSGAGRLSRGNRGEDRVGSEAVRPTQGGMLALLIAVGAAALAWYAWTAHLLPL
jgi:prephenate dehydratase